MAPCRAVVTVSPTFDCRTSFTPVMRVAHLTPVPDPSTVWVRARRCPPEQFGVAPVDIMAIFSRGTILPSTTHVRDHAAVGVVDGVEDHRPCRSVRLPPGAGICRITSSSSSATPTPVLFRHPQHLLGFTPDDVRDLARVPVWVGGRQVDLVEHRDDGEVVVHRQVQIRQRLRLDALRGVDEQHRPSHASSARLTS